MVGFEVAYRYYFRYCRVENNWPHLDWLVGVSLIEDMWYLDHNNLQLELLVVLGSMMVVERMVWC